jgi:hypothetical protein
MKKLLTLLVFLLIPLSVSASDGVSTQIYNPPIPIEQIQGDWGNDFLVSSTEPLGKPSGLYRLSNTTVYVSVPDTSIMSGKIAVILTSTNNGANWAVAGSVNAAPPFLCTKTKMVRSGLDSIYCAFIVNTTVYVWNVVNNNVATFTPYTNVRDFDIAASSTGSLYVIVDLNTNNETRFYGSANGGATWGGAVFLSSVSAHPQLSMSRTGDTLLINYYGVAITPDTISSVIRSVRYRENTPGALVIVGAFSNPILGGSPKPQFQAVLNSGNAWLFYAKDTLGSTNINCIVSTNTGLNFGTPITIGALPGRNSFYFDAKYWESGADLIFYSDSVAGGPNNVTDVLMTCYATTATPSIFGVPVRVSEHPPVASSRNYYPTLIEYLDVNDDAGALWVGLDGANRKLYYDRFSSISGISNNGNEIPAEYSLSQNYPNPFNPVTKINFAIPKNDLVILKVYNALGAEVATLVNKNMNSGSYTVDFDASLLSSGVYFYTLNSGSFTFTKKMMLIK